MWESHNCYIEYAIKFLDENSSMHVTSDMNVVLGNISLILYTKVHR